MAESMIDPAALKQLLKEALAETLREERDLLHEVFAEMLEDLALSEAIREGQQTDEVSRDEVFTILQRGT